MNNVVIQNLRIGNTGRMMTAVVAMAYSRIRQPTLTASRISTLRAPRTPLLRTRHHKEHRGRLYGTSGYQAPDQETLLDPAEFYGYTIDAAEDVPGIVQVAAGPQAGVCS